MQRTATATITAAVLLMTSMTASMAMAQTGSEEDFPERSPMAPNSWLFGGNDRHNTRSAPAEYILSPRNVGNLEVRWIFTTHGNVSVTPAVQGDALYLCDWGGFVYKINAHTGQQVWARKVSDYDGIPESLCRVTPAVDGDKIIIGDQVTGSGFRDSENGQNIIAINKNTGALVWKTQVETHPTAIITQSPMVHGGRVYVGVSSGEEGLAGNPTYPCCNFRGSVVALDVNTGAILWKTYMVPEGYAGAGVWGGTPVVDLKRRSLYVTTGNNYSVPAPVQACADAAGGNRYAL